MESDSGVDELTEARELIRELLEHLDYCGWGDSWEREGSEALRQKASAYADKHGL